MARKHRLFSIVIPTLNEGDMLTMTVENILSVTTYPEIEIIVIDDGSTDGSCDRYRSSAGQVRVVTTKRLGIPMARNLGAEQAQGDYVLFLDAHCTVSPNWIDRFVAALAPRDVAIVGPAFTRLHEPEPKGCGKHLDKPSSRIGVAGAGGDRKTLRSADHARGVPGIQEEDLSGPRRFRDGV